MISWINSWLAELNADRTTVRPLRRLDWLTNQPTNQPTNQGAPTYGQNVLPLYSPYFKPIDASFYDLKTSMFEADGSALTLFRHLRDFPHFVGRCKNTRLHLGMPVYHDRKV